MRNRNNALLSERRGIKSGNVLEDVNNQNITNQGFFISKAEVEILKQSGNEKFIATIKYSLPGRYLISLKSRTGIEGARIYFNHDSVVVNDRINKKLYFVHSLYVEKNFGLSTALLGLVFGDIILDRKELIQNVTCENSRLESECTVNGVRLKYLIDCDKRKSISVGLINNYIQKSVEISYDRFVNRSGILVPGEIVINDYNTNTKLKIKIIKIETPWNGIIEFIPGKGYELIEL
jgi:hypothetical protein